MLVWAGAGALSAFQLDKLLTAVRACVPRVSRIVARHEHCLSVARGLTASEEQTLRRLLADELVPALAGQSLLVIPRVGTISPWSSKATDIVHSCGLEVVRRVERLVRFSLVAPLPLTAEEIATLAPLLHDRMTQTLLDRDVLPDDLFAVHAPAR